MDSINCPYAANFLSMCEEDTSCYHDNGEGDDKDDDDDIRDGFEFWSRFQVSVPECICLDDAFDD